MVHQHYGTQTVNRGAVMPGMLVKHKDGTWTASANLRGRLYLHRGIERTYTRDLLVEVFLDGRGNGLNHSIPFLFTYPARHFAGDIFTAIFRSSAMNAYYIQDRLEAQSWARHYQQIAREEKEAELAERHGKGLPQHLFESLCIDHLQRWGQQKAITRAFDDDVEFSGAHGRTHPVHG